MPETPITVLIGFVLDRIESESIGRQIELYEALAEIAASPSEAREFHGIASDLRAAQRRQRVLKLDFTKRQA